MNRLNSQKTAALAVVLAGVLGSLYIAFDAGSLFFPGSSEQKQTPNSFVNESDVKNIIADSSRTGPQANLTEQLVDNTFNNLSQGYSDDILEGKLDPNRAAALDQDLQRAITQLEPKTLSAGYDIKITVSNDNSKAAKKTYDDRLTPLLGKIVINADTLKGASVEQSLRIIVENLDEVIPQAMAIPVPSDWAEYHRKGIEYLMLRRDLYGFMSGSGSDPFKALAAMQYLQPIEMEFGRYMQSYSDVIRKELGY